MADKDTKSYGTKELLRRLFGEVRGFRLHLLVIVALSLLATPLTLLMPVPLKIVVDSVVGDEPLPGYLAFAVPDTLESGTGALLAVAVVLFIMVTLLSQARMLSAWYLESYTGEKLVLGFRAKLFSHLQRLSLRYHDRKGSSDSTYRIQYDANSVQQVFIGGLIPMLTSIFPVLGIVVVTAFIDWQLTLIALAVCPILILLVKLFGRHLKTRWKSVKQLDSSAMNVVQEVLSTLRVVKAFRAEEREEERFVEHSERRVQGHLSAIKLSSTYHFLVGTTVAIATALVLLFGALHVNSGILTLGELIMVMTYMGQIFGPLQQMSRTAAGLANGLASAERVYTLLDQQPQLTEKDKPLSLARAAGEVEFEHVSFSYEPGSPVFRDLSFHVTAGTRVGIRGQTGAGKSTLMSLLMRFYDPDSGRVKIDGVDIRDFRVADLREQFAIVLQEPVLFSTTVAENIAYGNPGASQAQIERAARLANAHDFISELSEGYDTEVGERGVMLSGGERQRIALARAFLRDAPILILDEPTSAVDMDTESMIIEALEKLMEGRTSFTIAHRLSTLESCDVIYELTDGKLVLHAPTPNTGEARHMTSTLPR